MDSQHFVCPLANQSKSLSDDWLDNQDVTMQLHISLRTLQELRSKGVIPYTKLGNKVYYRRADIENLLKANFNYGHK
ncbi:MAG: helix-turn-helix domain-containing protein [Bacteroidales bacterium]|nr:helix-turn-helix domain-containing protein [Bacteroidales bacterium]